MLAILYALREELKPFLQEVTINSELKLGTTNLLRGSWQQHSLILVRTGIGPTRAAEATRRLLEFHRPSMVLSIGYAGGLHFDLKRGDWLVAQQVSDNQGNPIATDPTTLTKIVQRLRTGTQAFHKGSLLTVPRALTQVEEKHEAGKKGFLAVDMETYAAAQILSARKIPLASLRVIFDPLEETLPFENNEIGKAFVKNPKLLLKIPRLFQANRLCQQRIYDLLTGIIPLLSPFEKGG